MSPACSRPYANPAKRRAGFLDPVDPRAASRAVRSQVAFVRREKASRLWRPSSSSKKSLSSTPPPGGPGACCAALDGVSLSIEPGEIFGLVGPNRAGKTTLVKILLSICRPTTGRVLRLGAPWWHRASLARVGYMHESPAFPRYLTAPSAAGILCRVGPGARGRGAPPGPRTARPIRPGRSQPRADPAVQQGHAAAAGAGSGLDQRTGIVGPGRTVGRHGSVGPAVAGRSAAGAPEPRSDGNSCLPRPGRRAAAVQSRGGAARRPDGLCRPGERVDRCRRRPTQPTPSKRRSNRSTRRPWHDAVGNAPQSRLADSRHVPPIVRQRNFLDLAGHQRTGGGGLPDRHGRRRAPNWPRRAKTPTSCRGAIAMPRTRKNSRRRAWRWSAAI